MTEQPEPGLLHQPDYLRGLAEQLRAEAERVEARATRLETGAERARCEEGCWQILSNCIAVTPL